MFLVSLLCHRIIQSYSCAICCASTQYEFELNSVGTGDIGNYPSGLTTKECTCAFGSPPLYLTGSARPDAILLLTVVSSCIGRSEPCYGAIWRTHREEAAAPPTAVTAYTGVESNDMLQRLPFPTYVKRHPALKTRRSCSMHLLGSPCRGRRTVSEVWSPEWSHCNVLLRRHGRDLEIQVMV